MRGGEEGVGKGALSVTPRLGAPRIPGIHQPPAPLAASEGPAPAQWPGPYIHTLPPLALGGMGGDGLRRVDITEIRVQF